LEKEELFRNLCAKLELKDEKSAKITRQHENIVNENYKIKLSKAKQKERKSIDLREEK
jgi:hypothetical protein